MFFGAIDADDVKISQTARKILLVVPKKEEGFWPRLLEAAGKPAPNIKVSGWRACAGGRRRRGAAAAAARGGAAWAVPGALCC